jgi:D-glycero-D-manno-heptose 1,7-bisphosphate phosphatase
MGGDNGERTGAIFMDRDGVISEEVGYMYHSRLFSMYPFAAEAIKRINDSGIKAILTTNQSGIGRGLFREETVHEVHDILQQELLRWKARLDAIYICPHAPDANCHCRKPKPGMLLRAARELEIDLSRSFMIGDKYSDIHAALNAGARGVLVCTGYGGEEMSKYAGIDGPQPHFVAENLLHAVDAILTGQVR